MPGPGEKCDNAECESACKPRRARPEAHIYGIVLLAKDPAIRCEARFVAARFRSRRGMAYTSEAPLEVISAICKKEVNVGANLFAH